VRHVDFALNRAGQEIERQWKARVYSTYGVTELAASCCECAAGCGGHLHPTLLYLEALDDEGRPVPDGSAGEITATTLGVEGMPLVRYRTGDVAAIHREPCRCGRATLRVGPIVGRKSQRLKLKGTTLFPSTLKGVLDSVPGVASYVILARRESPLSDAIEVRLACSEDPDGVLRVLRERFQGGARVVPTLTVAAPAEIEALRVADGQRKRRYFVDLRDAPASGGAGAAGG
jgi:phenylacetate-CoA ligase